MSSRVYNRVIGRAGGDHPGPTLILIGSIHGNEPAGAQALTMVFSTLNGGEDELRGEAIGLIGNLRALASNVRYLDVDLNRHWSPERISEIKAGGRSCREDPELAELLHEIETAIARARGPVYVLDLHTTSGASSPFSTVEDTLRNRALALELPIPLIVGLEEHVEGTLLHYLGSLGIPAVGVESGQHQDIASVDSAEACAWITLSVTGILPQNVRAAEVTNARAALRRATHDLPGALEVRHRQPAEAGTGFQMNPGYRSFQQVRRGEVLARNTGGSITAREAGRLLMPLYQAMGDDGFFLMREFSPFWLTVSSVLRRMRVDTVAHWLPGVRRDPLRADALMVNKRIARWFALELFHLLGYRRERSNGRYLTVSKRTEPR